MHHLIFNGNHAVYCHPPVDGKYILQHYNILYVDTNIRLTAIQLNTTYLNNNILNNANVCKYEPIEVAVQFQT